MTIKIDNLFILVDFKTQDVYPRIFTSQKEAEKTNKSIGNTYQIKRAFIND